MIVIATPTHVKKFEELFALADEKPHGRKELGNSHCNSLGFGRANDRVPGQALAEECGGFRYDQVGSEIPLRRKRRSIQIWENKRGILRIGQM
jgi:hypothetical protein